MERLSLGKYSVPRIGFGTLYITEQRGFGADIPNAWELLQEAVQLGVQFIGTADSYDNGAAEQAIHDALYPYDDQLMATKGGYRHERLGAWTADTRPDHLRHALEGSLKRLGVEAIDLYQLHCVDTQVPYAEAVGALVDLKTKKNAPNRRFQCGDGTN